MKKKILAFVVLAAMLLNLLPVYAAGGAAFEAETVAVNPGETAKVNIWVKNSPGITSFAVDIAYDTAAMTLTAIERGDSTNGMSFVTSPPEKLANSPVNVRGVEGSFLDISGDWLLAVLTFQVKAEAAPGSYPVELSYDPDNVYNSNEDNVHFDVIDGAVEVKGASVAVAGVTLNTAALALTEGQTAQLTASVTPADAADKSVVFASSATSVATVDASGLVTAVSAGTAVITVTTNDGGFTAECAVTVGCAHTEVTTVPAQESTCVTQGWDEHTECDDCGQLFDGEGNEIATKPFRPLSGNHTGGTATCTNLAVCSLCGTPYGSLAAHNYTAAQKKAEALKSAGTCTAEAVYFFSCSACGKVENNAAHTFKGEKDAASHSGTTQLEGYVPADHKNQVNGYSGDTVWQCCGAVASYGTVMEAGVHTPGEGYQSDANNHWKVCSQSGCGAVLNLEAHTPDHTGGATEEYAVKCTVCGYVIEAQLAHTHNFQNVVKPEYKATDATCTAKATYYKSCSACGEKSSETFETGSLAAHSFQNVVKPEYKATDATCTAKATYYKSCSACGEKSSETFETGSLAAHSFQNAVKPEYKATDATCTAKATYYKSCSACGEKSSETFETGSLAAHSFQNAVKPEYKATDATCTAKATYYKSCSACGEKSSETFEAGSVLPHTPDHEAATEEYPVKCTECGKILEEQLAHTHNFQMVVKPEYQATEATCTAKATYYKTCACGEKSDETFEAGSVLPHTPDHEAATEEYPVKCTECGKILEEQLAHTHNFQNVVKPEYLATEATCTAKATYYKTCACGQIGTETFEAGELAEHTFAEEAKAEYKATDATCTAKATYYKSCSACGEKNSETFAYGELLPHTPDHEAATEEYPVKCTECGKILEEQLAHTHNFQMVVKPEYQATEATCTAKATYYKTCACGQIGTETFEAGELAEHTFAEEAKAEYKATDATCTAKATYYKSCSACGEKSSETFAYGELAAHTFKKIVADEYKLSDATCTQKAAYCESCSVCGEKSDKTFTAGELLPHTPDHEAATEEYPVKCTECGKILENQLAHTHNYQEIPAPEYKATDATCKKQATYYKSCACGEKSSKTFAYGELAPHDFQETVKSKYKATDATCTEQATYYKSCAVCGEKSSETFAYGELASHKIKDIVAPEYLAAEATCTAKAVYYKSCAVCGEKSDKTFTAGALLPHTPDHEAATEEYPVKCTECGKILENQLAHTHNYQEIPAPEYKATDATCKKQATYYKSCACGEKSSKTFAYGELAPHDFRETVKSKYKATDATCTEQATYYKSCAVCGEKSSETFAYGELASHKIKDIVAPEYLAAEATCTAKAVYYKSCAVCGEKSDKTFTAGELLPHTPDHEAATEEYPVKCTECGKILEEQLNHTHKFEEVVKPEYKAADATCTAKATYYKSCACGQISKETFEVGELVEHVYVEAAEAEFKVTDATCIEKATYCKSCEYCGEKSEEIFTYGELAAHTPDHEGGATEEYGITCTVCGEILEEKLEHVHNFKEVVAEEYKVSDATCTEKAVYFKSCICGEKSDETFESGALAAHTPDESGLKCTVCGGDIAQKPKPETPETGDHSMPVLWCMLALIAAMGMTTTVALKKRVIR